MHRCKSRQEGEARGGRPLGPPGVTWVTSLPPVSLEATIVSRHSHSRPAWSPPEVLVLVSFSSSCGRRRCLRRLPPCRSLTPLATRSTTADLAGVSPAEVRVSSPVLFAPTLPPPPCSRVAHAPSSLRPTMIHTFQFPGPTITSTIH